jgi:hypothetical protein
MKRGREKREKEKKRIFVFSDLKLELALSRLEDIQGGCFPD